MKRKFIKFIKDQDGSIVTSDYLLILSGVVIVSGIILTVIMSPLSSLHANSVENITNIVRGY